MSGASPREEKSTDASGDKSKRGRHSRRGSFSDALGSLGRKLARSVSGSSLDANEKKAKPAATKKSKKKDKMRSGGGGGDDSSSSSSSSSSQHRAEKSRTAGGRSDAEEEDLLLDGTQQVGRSLDARFASSSSLPELPPATSLLDSPRSQPSPRSGEKKKQQKSKGTIERDELDEILRAQRAALQDMFTEALAPLKTDLGRLKEQQATTSLNVQTLQTMRHAQPLVGGTSGRAALPPQPSPTPARASPPGAKTTTTMLDDTLDADFKRNPALRKTASCGCCCQ
jgi:hypothetical protein